jgi:pimeloyl-ACP methyl ester carboxylesterase
LVPKDPVINDFSLIPYDWRLPLTEIVAKGKVVDGKLYYGTSTSSLSDSFIVKELQRLADTSKSGKVTIIAHSNGGLVTKELIQELKETNNPLYNKIDKVIFVAVPQVGTPDAVVGLLHGNNIGPAGSYVSSKRTRDLFQNMPGMYNLLPTEGFFNNLSPLIEFGGSNPNQTNIANYGSTINTYQEYLDYLKGTEGRATPSYDDTLSPAKANQALLDQAIITHQRLDSWLPTTNTKVYQVAGWGIYTPSGIKYTEYKQCVLLNPNTGECTVSNPKTTISDQVKLNGDGTVLSGSAQAMGESGQVENWWVDLLGYNKQRFAVDRDHKSILEISNLRNLIKNIVTNANLPTDYVSQTEPVSPVGESYTKYEIHSPLHTHTVIL